MTGRTVRHHATQHIGAGLSYPPPCSVQQQAEDDGGGPAAAAQAPRHLSQGLSAVAIASIILGWFTVVSMARVTRLLQQLWGNGGGCSVPMCCDMCVTVPVAKLHDANAQRHA